MQDQETPAVMVAPTWPRDVYGITSGLRRELARVAGRLNGDPEKLDVFMQTVRAGAEWAKNRMETQAGIRAKQLAVIEAREKAAAEEQEKANANLNLPTDEQRMAAQRDAGIQGAVYNKGA